MKATIKICKAKNGEFYLSVTAINGRKLFHTETYKKLYYARKLAKKIQELTKWKIDDRTIAVGKS